MHKIIPNIFTFISKFKKEEISKLDKNIGIIFREYEKKYNKKDSVPRPPHWSGWRVIPQEVEFWLDGEGRIHERLLYVRENSKWKKKLLYP